ncbi:MAG: pyridoxamine 5'-phosphate oxidase family protein [Clostridiales bacterium]|jgi:uncharacterized pyridoxamine 5'-phosphate oxidase family protein|nr:pyridoxamine 5'-phosphate oxidase family protein [Clostridiales bacterium]
MLRFQEQVMLLFRDFGASQKMVLSTSLNDKVTSRTMSVVIKDNEFYFQTDIMFRKYNQIQNNHNVSLCIDNVQIEGACIEIGSPKDNSAFCELFKREFPGSFERYTQLKNERLFEVKPRYIQKWMYENGEAFVEKYDFEKKSYNTEQYIRE